MDGERITLRLEQEDLEIIDRFVDEHPEYSNRSLLARVAIRSFIERANGAIPKKTTSELNEKHVISVTIPRLAHETIAEAVNAGLFTSIEDAISQCVGQKYIDRDAYLSKIREKKLNERSETLEVLPR